MPGTTLPEYCSAFNTNVCLWERSPEQASLCVSLSLILHVLFASAPDWKWKWFSRPPFSSIQSDTPSLYGEWNKHHNINVIRARPPKHCQGFPYVSECHVNSLTFICSSFKCLLPERLISCSPSSPLCYTNTPSMRSSVSSSPVFVHVTPSS